MKKILVTFQPVAGVLQKLKNEFVVVHEPNLPSADRVIEIANQEKPEALFIANGQSYDAAFIAKLPSSIQIIATCSVGFEHIDAKACASRQILVTNTPDVLTEACADLAFFILLGAARRGKEALKLTQEGWGRKLQQTDLLGLDLQGKRLGILGMGRIGQAVAARARAFGMQIQYSNRKQLAPEQELGAKYFAHFHEMLPHCDFLSLHAPGGSSTTGIMGTKEFELLPNKSVFINISRGSLVDENALIKALETRKLFAAGLDVCLNEPHPNPRLLALENVFFTPHIASATEETRLAMAERALENIRAALNGKTPRDLVG